MSLLSAIKQLFGLVPPTPDLIHPVFGELVSDAIGSDDDLWQSEIEFEPLRRSIGLTINAGIDGPTQSQVDFYRAFLQHYRDHFSHVAPALFSELESWTDEKPVGDFDEYFEFAAMTVPRDGDASKFWSMSFECEKAHGHLLTVNLKDGKVEWVSADG